METDARPPGQLSKIGLMSKNWKRWKQDFLIYMKLTGGINKKEDEKLAWLKNLIGQAGSEALENISFDRPDDKENFTIVMRKLEEYFNPPKNEVKERNIFWSRSKECNESIDDYIEKLKHMAKHCNFGEQMENFVRDNVILHIKDEHLCKIIFEEKKLTLQKLKIIYKTYMINANKMKVVWEGVNPGEKKIYERNPRRTMSATRDPKYPCWRCGERHPQRECPAWKKLCCYCKQLNHFSYRCPVAKLDAVKINVANQKAVDKVDKNNLTKTVDDDDGKSCVKQSTLDYSDPVLNKFGLIDLGTPTNAQYQFLTHNNLQGQSAGFAHLNSKEPLSQTTTRIQPSAPPASMLYVKTQFQQWELSNGRRGFQPNENKFVESSEKPKQSTLLTHNQVPRERTNIHSPV